LNYSDSLTVQGAEHFPGGLIILSANPSLTGALWGPEQYTQHCG